MAVFKALFICVIFTLSGPSESYWSTFMKFFSLSFNNGTENGFPCEGFICPSSKLCISDLQRCDGVRDCTNGEDEVKCDIVQCREGYFECFDRNSCINMTQVCNGNKDCLDASDESSAACEFMKLRKPSSDKKYFSCGSEHDISLSYDLVCDGRVDCSMSNADESHCPKTKTCELRCKDSDHCIRTFQRCNKVNDCPNGSDEVDCYTDHFNSTTCPSMMKSCQNSERLECVPKAFWCDDSKDCSNSMDEKNCHLQQCEEKEFPCHSGDLCISPHRVCDSIPDCMDASDEKDCQQDRDIFCDTGSEFSCGHINSTHTTNQCVSLAQVCDGKKDCANGNDERGPESASSCKVDPCTANNGNCTQICGNIFGVSRCSCFPGYSLSSKDNSTCEDVNECAAISPSPCSHFCENIPAGYVCSCAPGYRLVNNRQCHLKRNRAVYYATPDSVRKFDLNRSSISQLLRRDRQSEDEMFTAMDVSVSNEKTTLILSELNSIYQVQLTDKFHHMQFKMITDEDLGRVESLVYDSANSLVYFIDEENISIEVISTQSKYRVKLITESLVKHRFHHQIEPSSYQPRSLIIDYKHQRLLWINSDPLNTRLECMDRDGDHHHIFLSGSLHSPVALAIDHVTDRLYWIDTSSGTLESASLAAGHRQRKVEAQLSREVRRQPYSLLVLEDHVLWSDIDHEGLVYEYNKRLDRVTSFGFKQAMTLSGIQTSQESRKELCSPRSCPYLCLPARNDHAGVACVCPDPDHNGTVTLCTPGILSELYNKSLIQRESRSHILRILTFVALGLLVCALLCFIIYKLLQYCCWSKMTLRDERLVYYKQQDTEHDDGSLVVRVDEDIYERSINSTNSERQFMTSDPKSHLIGD